MLSANKRTNEIVSAGRRFIIYTRERERGSNIAIRGRQLSARHSITVAPLCAIFAVSARARDRGLSLFCDLCVYVCVRVYIKRHGSRLGDSDACIYTYIHIYTVADRIWMLYIYMRGSHVVIEVKWELADCTLALVKTSL